MGKLLKLIPSPGIFSDVIVDVSVRGGVIVPPEVLGMPVWLGIIRADHHALSPKGLKNVLCNICFGIRFKRTVRDFIVRKLRIKHVEAIVMLGGKDHIFHPSF